MKHYYLFFFGIVFFFTAQILQGDVTDITGDTGTPQSGSLIISGGTSGALFDTSTSTITQSFNFLTLPNTTATDGQITIGSEYVLHTYGTANANTFVGGDAGNFTLAGFENTGCGGSALNSLDQGVQNTGIGQSALASLTNGNENTAVGQGAGVSLVDGQGNILIGLSAGGIYSGSESNNIIIAINGGALGESNTTRIGSGGQQACFIDGIYGQTVSFDSALPVFVDNVGTLGTVLSTKKIKSNIRPIGNDSCCIFELNPVSFTQKSDPNKTKQYGLIAEEVEETCPCLVIKDSEGAPLAVRYHELPVLLLNELQKKATEIETLKKEVSDLTARIEKLELLCKSPTH